MVLKGVMEEVGYTIEVYGMLKKALVVPGDGLGRFGS